MGANAELSRGVKEKKEGVEGRDRIASLTQWQESDGQASTAELV